jgi:hypothetical protein
MSLGESSKKLHWFARCKAAGLANKALTLSVYAICVPPLPALAVDGIVSGAIEIGFANVGTTANPHIDNNRPKTREYLIVTMILLLI